jgi:hypothetical protein
MVVNIAVGKVSCPRARLFLIISSIFDVLLELFEQAFLQNIACPEFIEGGREDVGMLVLRASRVRHHFFQHLGKKL